MQCGAWVTSMPNITKPRSRVSWQSSFTAGGCRSFWTTSNTMVLLSITSQKKHQGVCKTTRVEGTKGTVQENPTSECNNHPKKRGKNNFKHWNKNSHFHHILTTPPSPRFSQRSARVECQVIAMNIPWRQMKVISARSARMVFRSLQLQWRRLIATIRFVATRMVTWLLLSVPLSPKLEDDLDEFRRTAVSQ